MIARLYSVAFVALIAWLCIDPMTNPRLTINAKSAISRRTAWTRADFDTPNRHEKCAVMIAMHAKRT
ncbi:MAG: hypothetical protein J5896_01555 [Alphaproteobacteria bacterium]|nr:hypothetical protein [Alphaproteobacteria bacterium]